MGIDVIFALLHICMLAIPFEGTLKKTFISNRRTNFRTAFFLSFYLPSVMIDPHHPAATVSVACLRMVEHALLRLLLYSVPRFLPIPGWDIILLSDNSSSQMQDYYILPSKLQIINEVMEE